jgi:hypothetical protein
VAGRLRQVTGPRSRWRDPLALGVLGLGQGLVGRVGLALIDATRPVCSGTVRCPRFAAAPEVPIGGALIPVTAVVRVERSVAVRLIGPDLRFAGVYISSTFADGSGRDHHRGGPPDSERLHSIAKARQTTVVEVVHSAIEALERQEFLRGLDEEHRRLRDDPQ